MALHEIYSARSLPHLPLPDYVQDVIAKLRVVPAHYKPTRPPPKRHGNRNHHKDDHTPANWREKVLIEYVRRVREREDPQYDEVFGILNVVTSSTLEKLSNQAIEIIKSKDEQFRLRVAILLFNNGITQLMLSSVMADCAKNISAAIPEFTEDIRAQVATFPVLYDMTETLHCPTNITSSHDDALIAWLKQKEKRRGYAKFMTNLFLRGLVEEDVMKDTLQHILKELQDVAVQPKSDRTEENTAQFTDFLFETAKILPSGPLRELVATTLQELIARPRPEVPSLNMRSRFRLEDTVKCVQ